MDKSIIYLDNNATTRVAPEVFEAMRPYFCEQYGNPSSIHRFGGSVSAAVEKARILVAELLGQLGMGILMKVIPQINVFSINIELKVLIGFGLLFTLISPISEYLLQMEMTMLDSMEILLRSSAG